MGRNPPHRLAISGRLQLGRLTRITHRDPRALAGARAIAIAAHHAAFATIVLAIGLRRLLPPY